MFFLINLLQTLSVLCVSFGLWIKSVVKWPYFIYPNLLLSTSPPSSSWQVQTSCNDLTPGCRTRMDGCSVNFITSFKAIAFIWQTVHWTQNGLKGIHCFRRTFPFSKKKIEVVATRIWHWTEFFRFSHIRENLICGRFKIGESFDFFWKVVRFFNNKK